MQRRAELVDATRQRIVEATVRLHTTVGPANASIAAIAEEAGVTRLTVYRHFTDAEELFTRLYGAPRRPAIRGPTPATWATNPDLGDRARVALDGAVRLVRAITGPTSCRSCATSAPVACGRGRAKPAASDGPAVDSIVGDAASGNPRLRAVVGHVAALSTWRSLAVEQGLSTDEAVELAVGWVVAAGGDR